MYRVRTPHYRKSDQVARWALPDRVFFACGACHILAFAFLDRYGSDGRRALWLKPAPGFTGNHIVVDGGAWMFDYHGYSKPTSLMSHTAKRARHFWPGWKAEVIPLPIDVLVSELQSRAFDQVLWLREPDQFLHDALPRARAYLDRFPPPPPS